MESKGFVDRGILIMNIIQGVVYEIKCGKTNLYVLTKLELLYILK